MMGLYREVQEKWLKGNFSRSGKEAASEYSKEIHWDDKNSKY